MTRKHSNDSEGNKIPSKKNLKELQMLVSSFFLLIQTFNLRCSFRRVEKDKFTFPKTLTQSTYLGKWIHNLSRLFLQSVIVHFIAM